jgi:hypothetical protein
MGQLCFEEAGPECGDEVVRNITWRITDPVVDKHERGPVA